MKWLLERERSLIINGTFGCFRCFIEDFVFNASPSSCYIMQASCPPGKHFDELHTNVNIFCVMQFNNLFDFNVVILSTMYLELLHIQINTVAIQAKKDVPFGCFLSFFLAFLTRLCEYFFSLEGCNSGYTTPGYNGVPPEIIYIFLVGLYYL